MSLKDSIHSQNASSERPAYSVDGWVASDGFYSTPCESRVKFFINKPERVGSDRVQKWTALGFQMRLPNSCFPELSYYDEPIQIRLQLWRID